MRRRPSDQGHSGAASVAAVLRSRQGSLVLSPHADDAALSLAAAIADGLLPAPVTIATVFGRTNFGLGGGDIRCVSELRRREDQAFCRAARARLLHVGLPDACVRRPDLSIAQLFSTPLDPPSFLARVATEIADLVDRLRPRLLLGPMALGQHVDHRILRQVTLSAQHDAVLLYADQPYALACDLEREARARIRIRCSPRVRAIKADAARHYPSQPAAHRLVAGLSLIGPEHIVELAMTA